MDVTASLFLADGRECKIITGIDDHSRFCVIVTVVMRATARAVCLPSRSTPATWPASPRPEHSQLGRRRCPRHPGTRSRSSGPRAPRATSASPAT